MAQAQQLVELVRWIEVIQPDPFEAWQARFDGVVAVKPRVSELLTFKSF